MGVEVEWVEVFESDFDFVIKWVGLVLGFFVKEGVLINKM